MYVFGHTHVTQTQYSHLTSYVIFQMTPFQEQILICIILCHFFLICEHSDIICNLFLIFRVDLRNSSSCSLLSHSGSLSRIPFFSYTERSQFAGKGYLFWVSSACLRISASSDGEREIVTSPWCYESASNTLFSSSSQTPPLSTSKMLVRTVHSLISSFYKHLMSLYHVPNTGLGRA